MKLSTRSRYGTRMHKYIDHNPLREAERPMEQANGHEEEDKFAILTPGQITALLEQVQNQKYPPFS